MIKINNRILDFSQFPVGETIFNTVLSLLKIYEDTRITLCYENDDDLFRLMIIKKNLDDLGYSSELLIPYFPYSRQDRDIPNMIFTLKYFAQYINWLNFKKVIIWDPHSDVTPALINRVEIEPMFKMLLEETNLRESSTVNFYENDSHPVYFEEPEYVCLPDIGAKKRYLRYLEGKKFIIGSKERDSNGEIMSLDLMQKPDLTRKSVIIIDDLCSYGGTFLECGYRLRELGAERVVLCVTHAENSILKGKLLQIGSPIDHIYTTNSILSEEHPRITII